ncbi:diphosphomevalonate decarboxylase [Corynebacterium mendelii]|uniref:Diphosphomevalonate decarboxylase n=1 Tax=Corynebacterium mendelii TaxID=2765362 RepID=A0A939IUH7_9CORY|nr:diphosphomevalonate decarboxylase [Corynebacterium mendelii]MBN9643206.1 diphosphomevalonate decarboxylase [Corynebacterium mendelii]
MSNRHIPDDAAFPPPPPPASRQGCAWAPGKLILIGEHAVVFGGTALAVPFPDVGVEAVAVVSRTGHTVLNTGDYHGPIDRAPEVVAPLVEAARKTLSFVGLDGQPIELSCHGLIPPGRGLGASAAYCAAIVTAIARLARVELSAEQRFNLVQAGERVAHGNPSGLDARTVLGGAPICFSGGSVSPLSLGAPVHLVVADTGVAGNTRSAVSAVEDLARRDTAVAHRHLADLSNVAGNCREHLAMGLTDRVGQDMDRAHSSLQALGVSHPSLDRLVDAARRAGACGAKLTGAGHGGCMLALAADAAAARRIDAALIRAGAEKTWTLTLAPTPPPETGRPAGCPPADTAPEGPCQAVAHPNIALIKYWTKRDRDLVLPHTGSLSLTLDVFPTRTTVEPGGRKDRLFINGQQHTGAALQRMSGFLSLLRSLSGDGRHATVVSHNSVPTAAGLASSAAGFAAAALAGAAAYGLPTDTATLSRLARRGSGSACRSVIGDLALWDPGQGEGQQADETSYARAVRGPRLAMVIMVVNSDTKAVSSRTAMQQTVETSPYFEGWITTARRDLKLMVTALEQEDMSAIGQITERNALRMHAAIMANDPPTVFAAPTTLRIVDAVRTIRQERGLMCFATADAGPNVAVVCPDAELPAVYGALTARFPDINAIAARSGPGVYRA